MHLSIYCDNLKFKDVYAALEELDGVRIERNINSCILAECFDESREVIEALDGVQMVGVRGEGY